MKNEPYGEGFVRIAGGLRITASTCFIDSLSSSDYIAATAGLQGNIDGHRLAGCLSDPASYISAMKAVSPERDNRIVELVNRLGRAVHCMQFARGLNPAQWEALRFVVRANRYSRTPSALAGFLGTTKGTAS